MFSSREPSLENGKLFIQLRNTTHEKTSNTAFRILIDWSNDWL